MLKFFSGAVFFIGTVCSALADEPSSSRFGKGDFSASASIDFLQLFGDELVYEFDGSTISHLLWDTSAAMGITGEARYGVTDKISIYGSATIGLLADSYMEDYDYLGAIFGYYDWTHRSRHPDTALDHYFALDIGGRFDVYETETSEIGIIGGVRYTDVKWTAYGGDFVYSTLDFRDYVGNFPDGLMGISYQQKLPAYYTGIAGTIAQGNWTFDGSAMIGAVVGAYDIDHHWLRDLRFIDEFGTGLYLGASARATYKFNQSVNLTFGARYDHYSSLAGPTTMEAISTGDFIAVIDGDAAGGKFRALKLSAGLNAKF